MVVTDMMIGGVEGSEQHRWRVGLVVLVAGILLTLWAWGSWAYRLQPDPRLENTILAEPTPEQLHAASAMRWFLIVAFVIVAIGLFGSYVLLRMSRRYREAAARHPAPRTSYEDVWSMHKTSDDNS